MVTESEEKEKMKEKVVIPKSLKSDILPFIATAKEIQTSKWKNCLKVPHVACMWRADEAIHCVKGVSECG
jgi:hypothetical protein